VKAIGDRFGITRMAKQDSCASQRHKLASTFPTTFRSPKWIRIESWKTVQAWRWATLMAMAGATFISAVWKAATDCIAT
jgi:hypothetical protein